MLYYVLLVMINIDGTRLESFQGAFQTVQECIQKGETFSKDPYFESFECRGKVD